MPVPLRTNIHKQVEAKYNVVTEFPNFDLHAAAAAGNKGLVEYALSRGQPVNSVLDGVLPLHAACAGGNDVVVKLLIEHGADVNAPRLPRRYSTEKNRDASAPIIGTTGSTPLHFAAANGQKDVIMTLLLRGAHPDRADKHGVIPETLARQNGWLDCAELLRTWSENKDRDLRERAAPILPESIGPDSSPKRERQGSFGLDSELAGSGRKRVQVKRSIDTALNMLKVSSNQASSSSLTPPASPCRSRGESLSIGGSRSASPMPFDPNARRPSLPHVFNSVPSAPTDNAQRPPKSPFGKAPPSPRRPRSAGTGAEQEAEPSYLPMGRGGAGRMLGTKLSLLNLFKKGQSSEGGVPLERTNSHQVGSSSSVGLISQTPPSSSASLRYPLAATPDSNSSSPSLPPDSTASPHSNVSRSGFRFRLGSDASPSARMKLGSAQAASGPKSPSSTVLSSSPPSGSYPTAVELHNALAAQHQNRDRSGSSGSYASTFDDDGGLANAGSISSSPLSRFGIVRPRGSANRDRSVSNSGTGAGSRGGGVFNNDIVVSGVTVKQRKGSSPTRPGILRAHQRSTSSGQAQTARSLRFDSSNSSLVARGEDGLDSPALRECASSNSLVRFQEDYEDRSNTRRQVADRRPPDSAPADVAAFVQRSHEHPEDGGDADKTEDEDEDEDYGHTIDSTILHKPSPDPLAGEGRPTRDRGLSFTSSQSSLSAPNQAVSSAGAAGLPFSINQPPPTLEETDASHLAVKTQQLHGPPSGDNRDRGDSFSSVSTTDSGAHPQLSASGTTSGGSMTITTPVLSPDTGVMLAEQSDSEDGSHEIKISIEESTQESPIGPTGVGLGINDRRARAPLDIDLSLISDHAQAEALVKRAQQDIFDMAHDTPSATSDGWTPLSARLAAYGESLALERKLREQKQGSERELASPREATMRSASEVSFNRSPTSPMSAETPVAGVSRQFSLSNKSSSPRPRTKGPRRPHTAGGTSSAGSSTNELNRNLLSAPGRPTHHATRSASAVETTMMPVDVEDTMDSPLIKQPESPIAPRMPASLARRNILEEGQLSRVSSLDGIDIDADVGGVPLYRVSTSPAPSSQKKRDQARNMASATKLARMGFAPQEAAKPPPTSKRFGGIKSFVQSLKGKS